MKPREPEGFSSVAKQMAAFPGLESARAMRRMGVRYVVVHTEHYADGAQGLLATAEASPDFSVIARDGPQVLYAVRPGR